MERKSVFWLGILETIIVGGLIYLLLLDWYPNEYSVLFEARPKFLVFLALLFILGPLLGAFVYKPDQVTYLNDLTVITLLKTLVVFGVIHYAYTHRPILTVFSVDRFVVVQAHQIPSDHIPVGIAKMIVADDTPPLIAARQFDDRNLSQLLAVMGGAPDIEYRPSHYERFEYQRENFIDRFCYNSEFEKSTSKIGNEECQRVSVPLVYRVDQLATAVFDVSRGEVLEFTSERPWQ